MLEHIEHPANYFREAARVLRDEGSLLLVTNSIYSPVVWAARAFPQRYHRFILNRVLRKREIDYDNAPVYYRANSRKSLLRLCEQAGFSRIKITHVSGMHEYFHNTPLLGRIVFVLGGLITDNRLFARFKQNMIVLVQK